MNNLKPIETRYNGNLFRSRTEARWAVFFSTLNLEYKYEHEGFDLDGTWYLPDFWLPELGFFFEVKGVDPTDAEIEKARLLTEHSRFPTFIAIGAPGENDHQIIWICWTPSFKTPKPYFSDCWGHRPIKFKLVGGESVHKKGWWIGLANDHLRSFYPMARITPRDFGAAFRAANYARFEHGTAA